ncbi:MAG: ATP-dependent DNA helicase, partial [Rectinema sp.]|nr:ATP-dependent DNA helicase [Rectinema sp.]
KGIVTHVDIIARGSEGAVPAPFHHSQNAQVLIHNHPSGSLFPSDADVAVAAEAGSQGMGSYIVDNEVEKLFVVMEPVAKKHLRPLDADEIAGVLDAGGKLSEKMPSFEPRPSQVDMARDVARTISEGGVLIAEAGTGVGKSFAYLVPAMAWAAGNGERVVISTATITLQEQIHKKDFPVISALFRKPVKAVIVKGRGNYLCKRRLYEAIEEDALFSDTSVKLRQILEWDNHGGGGDRSELSIGDDDPIWNRICSESDFCLLSRCPQRERCHVMRVRMEAASAQIIIVNHHVLLADLEAKRKRGGILNTILPPYQALVIDEAHALESSATSLFSESFSIRSFQKIAGRLIRRKKRTKAGILPSVGTLPGVSPAMVEDAIKGIDKLIAGAERVNQAALDSFKDTDGSILIRNLDAGKRTILNAALGTLEKESTRLVTHLGTLYESLEPELMEDERAAELALTIRTLEELAALVPRFRTPKEEKETIFWLEVSRHSQKEPIVTCIATPLEVAPLLAERLFSPVRACVCTSATLTINGSFDWWKKRVGLGAESSHRSLRDDESASGVAVPSVRCRGYPSPFPYRHNAMLAIDTTAPLPDSPQFQEYLNQAVVRLIEASRGRALVLFTSYRVLHATFDYVAPILEQKGILAMRQGQKDRFSLLNAFVNDISSVLFATESFW